MDLKIDLSDYEDIPTIRQLDVGRFDQVDRQLCKPFKLIGATDQWLAINCWTSDYLSKHFGKQVLQASRNGKDGKESKMFTLEDYLLYMNTDDIDRPYYLKDCKFHLNTEMENHYQVPEPFKCWYREIPQDKRKTTLSWLYIGAKNTFSKLHLDIWNTSAWNVVISGLKLWFFYEPNDAKYLYDGEVNPFNFESKDFPLLKYATPKICLQRPGELVFTPSNWWHAVYNLEKGISITENFINESNVKDVLEFFSNKSEQSYLSLKEIVNSKIKMKQYEKIDG